MKYIWIAALAAATEGKKQCAKTNCFQAAQAHPEQCSSFLKETLVPCSDNVDFTVTSTNTLEAITNTIFTPVTTPTTVTDTTSTTSTTTVEKSAFTTTTVWDVRVPTTTVTVTSTVMSTIRPLAKRYVSDENAIFVRDRRGNVNGDDLTPTVTPGASCTAVINKPSELPEFATACGYAGYEALSSRVVKACSKAGVEGETVTLAQGTVTVTRTAFDEFTPSVDVTQAVTKTRTVTVTDTIVVPETAETTITTITNTDHSTLLVPTTTTTTSLTTSVVTVPLRRDCTSEEQQLCSDGYCAVRVSDTPLFLIAATCDSNTSLQNPTCRTDADCVAKNLYTDAVYCVANNFGDDWCPGGTVCATADSYCPVP